MLRATAVLLCVCVLASGCAGMNPDARAMLQEPASCENPQGDTETLEASRAGGGKRFLRGLQGIMPPMIVLSLLRDIVGKPYRSIYLDHWRVAFGSYNRKIDERVTELKQCE
jgi:hypothetical protein